MADHLLEEVNAELRADHLATLWKRYRNTLLLAVIALIVGTAGNSVWQSYTTKKGGTLMLQLTEGQQHYAAGKFTEAADIFATAAASASADAKTLAQLWQGRALSAAGKKPEAITVLGDASATRSLWGDLACLRLASLSDTAPECLGDATDSPLLSERRAWSAAARWQEGKREEAIAILDELTTAGDTREATRAELNQWLATMRSTQPPSVK